MLTVVQIQALKLGERPYKVADHPGLYLLVQPSGTLLWRYRYRCCGVERKLSLGIPFLRSVSLRPAGSVTKPKASWTTGSIPLRKSGSGGDELAALELVDRLGGDEAAAVVGDLPVVDDGARRVALELAHDATLEVVVEVRRAGLSRWPSWS